MRYVLEIYQASNHQQSHRMSEVLQFKVYFRHLRNARNEERTHWEYPGIRKALRRHWANVFQADISATGSLLLARLMKGQKP